MGKIKVTKDSEVLEIEPSDLKSAINDGYRQVQTIPVTNGKEVLYIDDTDLENAIKDGYVKKKDDSNVTAKPSDNGLSNGQAINQEIPIVSLEKEGEQDPITLALQADELANKKTTVGFGMGAREVPDEVSLKKSNDIADVLKEQNIDAKYLASVFKGLPVEVLNAKKKYYNDLLETEPTKLERVVAHDKWKNEILSKIQNVDERNFLSNILSQSGQYENKRNDVKTGIELVRKYSDNPDEAQKNFATEASVMYGTNLLINPNHFINNELTKYGLTANQIGAYEFLQDTDPRKAEQFKALLIDPSKIPTDYETQLGREDRALKLEQIGISLKKNAATEIRDEINKSINSGDNSPQILAAKEKNDADLAAIDNDINSISNGTKYLRVQRNDAEQFANELLGKKEGYGKWAANELGKATGNTIKGTLDLIATPFRSDESNYLRQLQLIGEGSIDENLQSLPQSEQMLQSFKPFVKKELQEQIDAIKNDNTLDEDSKHEKVTKLLMNNPTSWSREGIEGGKTNVNLKSLLYGTTQLAANLAPFVAITAATSGAGSGSSLARFTTEFAAAAATSFNDVYTQAIKEGDPNPYAKALRVTAINSAAMAGANTASEVRAMLGKVENPAVNKLLDKLTDKEITAALRNEPSAISNLRKTYNVVKGIGEKGLSNLGGAAKVIAFTTAGQAINDAIDNNLQNLPDYVKHAGIELLKFGAFGTLTSAFTGLKNKPTELNKTALYDAALNSDSYIKSLEDRVLNNTISKEEATQVKNNIEAAKKVLETVPMVDAKGKELSDVSKRELLFLKLQEKDIDQVLKSDIPSELADKLGKRIENIHEQIDKIYKGTFLQELVEQKKEKQPIEVPEPPKVEGEPEKISQPIESEKDITVGEMMDKTGTYKGEKGSFYQDGQTVVFKVEGKNKEYELGNVDELKDTPISDFDITHEQSVVTINDKGEIKVRDNDYVNNYSNPLAAINHDADGNVVSVNLETIDGKKRTFRGNIAEDIAYQINLKEINKDNETARQFEQHINEDVNAQKEFDNARLSETAKTEPIKDNETVSREKVKSKVNAKTKEAQEPIQETMGRSEQGNEPITPKETEPTKADVGETVPPFEKITSLYNEANNKKGLAKENAMKKVEDKANEYGKEGIKILNDLRGGEPPKEPVTKPSEGSKFNDKGILNRLASAENVPEHAKKGFEEKGLKYEVQSSKEAQEIGKALVDQYGIDDAIILAETNKFKGGVNSAIFAEGLNRLFKQEQEAKTPEEKLNAAKKFAEVGIRYDEFSRGQGRDISQIGTFYKKSPLGIKIMEEARRRERFDEFAKKKEQSWREFFNEMSKEPEFEKIFKEEVSTELKKERAETRKQRIKKVDEFFDNAIKKLDSGGAAYSTIIPITPKVLQTALKAMKEAYHAGEKVTKLVEDAIDYISKEVGGGWDKENFRNEWLQKLGEKLPKGEISLDAKQRMLKKFKNKLKGLNEKEKDEVIRKSFKKLVENGALEYEEFKQIIADTLGYGELTPEQSKKIIDLVAEINSVEELGIKLRENERSEEALKKYLAAKQKAEKAATELGKIVFNRVDITKRLLSIMQLNTLGVPSLVNNPIFNIVNQAAVRFPNSAIMTGMDMLYSLANRKYKPENNILAAQKGFYPKLLQGVKQSLEQLRSGLTNKDYFQKEVYASQIHPITSLKELWAYKQGKIKLTKGQVIDKAIQSTLGVPAEIIARVLNIGDKPQRFATEGGQAAVFAKNLGLQDIDYKLFMEFPKEEAYRKFKEQGLSDEVAMKKAEEIQKRIIREGEESTFQQDNLLNDALIAAFKPFGKGGEIIKTLNMPFVKIPLNAFWSVYNLANPEIALLQSAIYGAKALKSKSPLDIQNSKKWFAHAVTGMAWMAVTGALAKAGIVNSANDDRTTKKEREGEVFYEQQKSINITKLQAYLMGENPNEVKNGLNIDLKWLGAMGNLMEYQASKLENMTPEQRKNGLTFMEDLTANLNNTALDFMDNGVFSNTSSLLTAINKGGGFMDNYLLNLINMGTNIIQPAAYAQISRAELPYYTKAKADNFYDQLKNNLLTRSSLFRKLTSEMPPAKVGLWGDKLEKKDNIIMRLFGMSRQDKDNFAQPIYEDYKKTNDTRFFPSAVKPEIKVGDKKEKLNTQEATDLETFVGQERKKLAAPFMNDGATFEGSDKMYSELSEEQKIENLKIIYDMGYKNGVALFRLKYPKYQEPEKTEENIIKESESEIENQMLRNQLKSSQ